MKETNGQDSEIDRFDFKEKAHQALTSLVHKSTLELRAIELKPLQISVKSETCARGYLRVLISMCPGTQRARPTTTAPDRP